jgi:CelD/BcsL family acetyltransferase involved in cellulose biosynthesis
MRTDPVSFEIVDAIDKFRTLQPEWDVLWSEAKGDYFQSFSFCHSALSGVALTGHRLHCIVGRRDGRVVTIWPLVTYRRLLWKVATPLGPAMRPPNDILVAPEVQAPQIVADVWREMVKSTRADLVELWRVRSDSMLYRCAQHGGHVRRSIDEPTCYAHLRAQSDWKALCHKLEGRSRNAPDYLLRRLSGKGDVRVEVIGNAEERAPFFIDWLLTQKRHWAKRSAIESQWLFSDDAQKFLIGLFSPLGGTANPFRIFVLTLDGKPLAVNLLSINKECVYLLINTYDAEYAKWSPGTVLIDHCVKWSFDNRRDFDFGPGREPYKTYWSNGASYDTASLQVITTFWGRVGFAIKHVLSGARRLFAPVRKQDDVPDHAQNLPPLRAEQSFEKASGQ